MDNADQPGQAVNGEASGTDGEAVSRYEVVPYAAKTSDSELYAFRAAFPPPPLPPAPPTPAQQAVAANKNLILAVGLSGVALLLIILIAVVVANRQETAPAFLDLGVNHIASAGLGGRLIVKWDGKAEYELHIDPLVPQQIPGFSAVAGNPPGPLSLSLHLKDTSGSVRCQKEIVIPADTSAQADPAHAQPLVSTKTPGGDLVQNVAGNDGLIGEIVINGEMPCPVNSYKRLASWDFTSSFPSVADQEDWREHEQGVDAQLRHRAAEARARALIPRSRPLPAPIDGDDVIVFDNPSRGIVETKAGRVFYVGKDGLRGRVSGWQVFPAAIHFRCDLKANCVLTRSDASTSLQARLVH